jgi:hypothetical protein
MKLGLENIKSCLVQDEHKVRIYKEYFLPANCFILLIHDLTKMDLGKLDDLTYRYLKSWLSMPQSGSFFAITFWALYGYEECLASLQREPVP